MPFPSTTLISGGRSGLGWPEGPQARQAGHPDLPSVGARRQQKSDGQGIGRSFRNQRIPIQENELKPVTGYPGRRFILPRTVRTAGKEEDGIPVRPVRADAAPVCFQPLYTLYTRDIYSAPVSGVEERFDRYRKKARNPPIALRFPG